MWTVAVIATVLFFRNFALVYDDTSSAYQQKIYLILFRHFLHFDKVLSKNQAFY